MTVLPDHKLRELWPDSPHIGPASVDLHIGSVLWFWPPNVLRDPRQDQSDIWQREPFQEIDGQVWVLYPEIRYLATTKERISIPDDCAGQLAARSSWARDGLAVIQGPAGWCDPGYGNVPDHPGARPTLELSVTGSELVLWPGARCLQLIVFRLETPCERPYRGKYQSDAEPTPSRLHLETS